MGEFFAERFVAAHQQVGDFEVLKVGDKLQKQGGNVASYFCTAEGRVVHAVAGPVTAAELLEEARWAASVYDEASRLPLHKQAWSIGQRHSTAPPASIAQNRWRTQQIHQLLSERALAPLADVYDEIFGRILGQQISKAAPNLALAERGLSLAEETGRPLLFIFHRCHDNSQFQDQWNRYRDNTPAGKTPLRAVLRDYIVIALPNREAAALSQRLDRPPYDRPDGAFPLFVVARSDGEQLAAVSGWGRWDMLVHGLAGGSVDALERQPGGKVRELRRYERFLRRYISLDLADRVEAVIEAQIEQAAARLTKADSPASN